MDRRRVVFVVKDPKALGHEDKYIAIVKGDQVATEWGYTHDWRLAKKYSLPRDLFYDGTGNHRVLWKPIGYQIPIENEE